jgi:transcription antitermination protein NusB
LLYEAEMKAVSVRQVLADLPVAPDPFVVNLLEAAEARRPEAERLVAEAARGWSIERMAMVDRLVLQLATAELLDPDGPPVPVVIDEAVELAKTYSTDSSGGFVNGVLSTVARTARPLERPTDAADAAPPSTEPTC